MTRLLSLFLIAFASAALAQSQPYAGFEGRAIKALSEQQIADLRAGRGMGLALAAELNGYPGPLHVLELADALDLTSQQRTKAQELFAAMKAETVPLGEQLIAQEATQAALRQAHLKYHLSTVEVLTLAQIQRYAELRGYGGGMHHPQGRH
jgi:hypothetical protein